MPYQPAVLGTARLNNFRLNYLTADQAADRPTHIRIILGGIDITNPTAVPRVIYKSVSIKDVVFDVPNTCALTLYGGAPTVGQSLEVWVNSNAPVLLFGGELQTVERTYKGRPATVVHPCTAIDDTARANRKRPLRPYQNVSATTIAQDLIATYCPGFSSAGVEANLPAVSVNFDGSEGGLKGCLTQVAKLIGGYWYFENKTLYLFVTPPGTAPDPIDETPHRFAHDPAITWSMDKSQVRTRVYGKGASTAILTTIDASTALVPVREASMFNPIGGRAILGQTPDGAASRVVTYTGVQLGGGGALVGPGASPSGGPGLALLNGAGIQTGWHYYVVTFTTAVGESLPSPTTGIYVGLIPSPVAAPTPGAPTAGGSVDAGTHQYAVTFITAVGETTGSPVSAPVTTTATAAIGAPSSGPANFSADSQTGLSNALVVDGWYAWRYTFFRPTDGVETTLSPAGANTYQNTAVNAGYVPSTYLPSAAVPPAGYVLRWYRCKAAVSAAAATAAPLYRVVSGAGVVRGGTHFADGGADTALGPLAPATNTTGNSYQTVPITGIGIGQAHVTGRRIYRSSNGAPYQLVATIANNTATTYTDTTATAALGAVLPTTNTATANQVAVTVPIGGSSVTGRKLYRTQAGQTPLGLLTTIANNTATTFTDAIPDGSLGVPPPGADTSGLVQPSGQVAAGATSMIVANTIVFAEAPGGWAVVGNGEQVIRYTGKTATTLTGIPATGPGALVASVSYNSTITLAPALMGVSGILEQVLRGAPIHVWVQRDDTAAQAYMVTLDGGGDGIYEHIVSDERRSEASLIQVCDAELALYGRPLVTVVYATRDQKTKSGKTVAIALTSPAINESLTIQDVAISELGIRGLGPKFTVTASSVHHTFEAILQKLIRNAGA